MAISNIFFKLLPLSFLPSGSDGEASFSDASEAVELVASDNLPEFFDLSEFWSESEDELESEESAGLMFFFTDSIILLLSSVS